MEKKGLYFSQKWKFVFVRVLLWPLPLSKKVAGSNPILGWGTFSVGVNVMFLWLYGPAVRYPGEPRLSPCQLALAPANHTWPLKDKW